MFCQNAKNQVNRNVADVWYKKNAFHGTLSSVKMCSHFIIIIYAKYGYTI